jgi:hypothetical protein
VIALGVVGFISSRLRLPDNRFYIQASERMINPGCAEIHCFRVLVPWTIGAIPGNWLFKWKAYAVLANAGAAIAVFDLCLFFGMTRRASIVAGALSAFGFSSFGTIWQPYQSDPLMFWWRRSSCDGRSGIARPRRLLASASSAGASRQVNSSSCRSALRASPMPWTDSGAERFEPPWLAPWRSVSGSTAKRSCGPNSATRSVTTCRRDSSRAAISSAGSGR